MKLIEKESLESPDKLVLEFQQIIKKTYGKDLSYQEASQIAYTLVGYFDLLAKIYHEMPK